MKMMLVEHSGRAPRIALTNDGKLTELYVGKDSDHSRIGDVVVGRIATIMPGQYAFIAIGAGKNAFTNLAPNHKLVQGQPILVQVQKDATSTKGAYVSQDIVLKGWLVILHKSPPGEVGVSRKIGNENEVKRLKTLVRGLVPKGYGVIVRTNANGQNEESIAAEITKLHKAYEEILARASYALPKTKLYPKLSLEIEPVLNDMVSDSLDEVVISGDAEIFDNIKEYICQLVPALEGKITKYEDTKLFASYGVKKQIKQALEKIVPLACGGFITIEETEACVVIDVNTGNNQSGQSYRNTIMQTNLEAAVVIFDHIIVRNLQGIIIIDFIDMSKQEDKHALMTALVQESKRDRTNPEIFPMTALGIVQIARPKRRMPLSMLLEEKCTHCGGKGRVLSLQ